MEPLEKIKKDVSGVIGSVVIDKEGRVKFSNLPPQFDENLDYISKAVHLLVKNIELAKEYERILIEGDKGKALVVNSEEGDLMFAMDNNVNLALFKIIVEKAKAQLKIPETPVVSVPMHEEKEKKVSKELIDEIVNQVKSKLSGFGGSTMAENVIKKHIGEGIESLEDLERFIRSVCSAEITQIFGLTVAKNLERRLLERIKGGRT